MIAQLFSRKTNVFLSYTALASLTLLACLLSRSLIVNSHFSIDFENLLVFPWQSYLYLGGIISISLLLFLYSNWQIRWVEKQKTSPHFRFLALILSNALILGILYLLPSGPSPIWTAVGITSFSIIVDLFINPKEKNLTWMISWIIILSGFMAMVLFDGYLEYDFLQRKKVAKSLHHTKNAEAIAAFLDVKEKLIGEGAFQQILSVPFPFKVHRTEFNQLNNHILQPTDELPFRYVFNAFDKNGDPMIDESYTAVSYYEEFKSRSDTLIDELFFDPIENAYLSTWTHNVPNHENSPFTIYIEQYPKSRSNRLVSQFSAEGNMGKYDFAFYKKNRLASYSSPYILHEDDTKHEFSLGESLMVNRETYSDLYLQVGQDDLIKLSRKSARLIKPVSLFSFIFIYIALILSMLIFVNQKLKFIPSYLHFNIGQIYSLKNKLQLSIIALIIFSFFIIGIVTIYYFQNLSEQYDRDLLREKSMSLAMDVQSGTRHLGDEASIVNSLSYRLASLSQQHHVDLNIYRKDGSLALSSFPKVFENNAYPAEINKEVLGAFAQNKNQIKLDFLSSYHGTDFQQAYFPILNQTGNIEVLVHSLQVPVIKSNSKVSDFVGTLLNIYVFLFLIAGAIALAVSNSITKPLKNLGQKLKKLKLGQKNEQLDWQSNDELGQLVQNYNGMISQLDDSAKLIAKTERDLAWREMAKQVAHEIKNPLTPMKLSIQYLKRAIDQNPEQTDQLVDRVSSTLIEQIDNLSEIAGAFSNFGKMPQSQNDKVTLNEVVEAIHDLFRKRLDMDINMYEPIDELYVFADKNALVRILNNIVKNAIQSIPTDRRGHIDLKLYKSDKMAIVRISDNGIGISDDRKDKVFLPNFTTKSSGTGLGLAICANMVESFNGRLFFESKEGIGTDFYLEIPLMHVNDNFEEQERVYLDD